MDVKLVKVQVLFEDSRLLLFIIPHSLIQKRKRINLLVLGLYPSGLQAL